MTIHVNLRFPNYRKPKYKIGNNNNTNVSSHTSIIIGNELADRAANETIVSPSSVSINKIEFQGALITINILTKIHWQDTLEETLITNKFKEIKPSINPWKFPSPTSRYGEVVGTRTWIGNSRLTHLHLITTEECPI